jgi:hypothetical protein
MFVKSLEKIRASISWWSRMANSFNPLEDRVMDRLLMNMSSDKAPGDGLM